MNDTTESVQLEMDERKGGGGGGRGEGGEDGEEKKLYLKNRSSNLWTVCGQSLPKAEIVYMSQIFIIVVVITVSLFNLTNDPNKSPKLWIALLSSCLGYILPNPKLEK